MQCVDRGGRRIFKKIFFQAEDGIRDVERSRGLGDVYKRQLFHPEAQAGARGLLQGRGNKRRRRFRAGGPLLTLADGQCAGVFQCLLVGTGIVAIVRTERHTVMPVSYTHLRAHETSLHLVCRLLLKKKFF